MKKKLDIYRGRLTPAQIADGMTAASKNARRLLEDAELMLKEGRVSSAAALAILSIEESGKNPILRAVALAKSDQDILEEWRNYRSHVRKNVAWILPQLVAAGARTLEDLRPAFSDSEEHPYVLDQLKQIAFYTDCLGHAHWSIPEEVINKSLAETLVNTARILLPKKAVTEKEIELWIKHLGPVWKQDMAWMKQALINWHDEMKQLGLADEGKMEFSDFVRPIDKSPLA